MTDLIERIENYIQHVRPFTEDGQLFCEVQDEIERLRGLLKYGRRPGKSVLPYLARIKKLEAVVRDRLESDRDWNQSAHEALEEDYE